MLTFSGITLSGDVEVAEDDLPTIGSSPSAAVTKNGNFTITSSAGLNSLSFAGTVLVSGGVVVPGAVAVTTYGEVRVLAYDAATGLVSYSFKLVSPVNTPGADDFLHVVPMVAFDMNGAEYHSNLPIRIIDDAPVLVADAVTLRQHQTNSGLPTESVSGNILTGADRVGADGLDRVEVVGSGVGTWGTLVIQPNGAYTYTLSETGKTMLAGLPDDVTANVTEIFTYTVYDGDGDARTSTLTVTLTGDDLISITGTTTGSLHEKNLPLGTEPDAAALTRTGQITIHAPDGLKDVKVGAVFIVENGVFQNPAAVRGGQNGGSYTFTGFDTATNTLSYSYTLDTRLNVNTNTSSGDNVTLNFIDHSGTSVFQSLVSNIFDDVIDAIDDVVPLAFNATGAFTGNVLTNDLGADRAFTVTSAKLGNAATFTNVPAGATGINLVGSYGTLTIRQDGSYTYTRNAVNPQGQTDVFQYTARDADSDTDVATLAFTFAATPPSPTAQFIYVPGTVGGTFTVYEAGLDVRPGKTAGSLEAISPPDGSHNGEMLFAGFTYSVGAGLTATVRIADVIITGAGQVIDLPNHGRLTILSFGGGNGTFKYEILDNTLAAGTGPTQNFALRVTDSLNRSATDTAQLTIVDDAPVMTGETRVAAATNGFQVSGNLLENDRVGADGLAKFEVNNNGTWTEVTGPTTVTTSQGTFVIQTNGNYTYTVGAGASVGGSHTLAYRITDGDGDLGNWDEARLTVNFQSNGNVPWAGTTVAAVDDDALPTAYPGGVVTGGASASGTLPFTYGPDGKGAGGNIAFSNTSAQPGLSLNWVGNTLTGSTAGQGNIFTVTVDQFTGAYTLTLLKGYPFGETILPLTFTVTDANGDTATGQLNVMFGDARPGPFTAEAVSVGSAPGASVVGDLNSNQNPGPDAPGTISFQNSLSLNSPANGVIVKDITGKDVTFNGVQLRWYIGSDASIVEARTPNGQVAFSVDLDLVNDTFRVDVHEIDVTDVRLTSATNFGSADMRGMNVGVYDVVLTSKAGQPVGTGPNLGGTKALNAVGDMLRLDFIKGVSGSGSSVSYGEYYAVTQMTQAVSATGFGTTVSFTVRAIKVNGETQADGVFAGDPDDVALTPDADTSDGEYFYIQFLDSTGRILTPAEVAGRGITITAVDTDGDSVNDAWSISNMPATAIDLVQFRIVSSTAFSAVEIEATKAGTSMRLDPPWVSVPDEPGRGLQAGGGTGAFTINVPVYRTDIDSTGTAGGTFGEMHVTFEAPPPPPVVTTSIGTTNFVEKAVVPSTAVVIDAGILVSDPDSGTLTSGRVIINNYQAGDVLGFVGNANTGNIAVSGNIGDVLYLTSAGGTATVAQWQAAFRAVTFLNTSDTPNTTARSISFVVSDGQWESAPANRTVSVTAVNDPPTGQDNTITILEDEVYHFKLADFPFTDPENNSLLNLQVTTLATSGTLWRDNDGTGPNPPGFIVNAGNSFTLGNLNSGFLVYVPGANAHGTGYATFTYRITDNGGTANSGVAQDPVARTITINVVSVNDAPEGADVTRTVKPDQTFAFSVDDFGFSDPDDAQAPNELMAVRITTPPATGQLLLIPPGGDINDGIDVTAGQFVQRADIEAGRLVYVAPSDATGTGYAQFTFQVQDDGGTANNGVNLDQTPRTFTFDAVNAAPVVTPSSGDTGFAENGSPVLLDPNLTLTDQDNDTLVSVTISITSGFVSGQDVLGFASGPAFGDIAGAYNAATGSLTLTSAGSSTLAQWQAALRAVTYHNTSGELTPGPRIVSILAHDGEDESLVATKTVEVASVFGPSITFLENTVNATPQLLDVNVSFTDVTKVLDGGTLVVKGLLGEDRVSVRDQGAGAGEIGFNDATGEITYGGTLIGTAAGGLGDTFTITYNAAATTSAVEAVMRNITYGNVSDDPTETRTLEVLITNAGGEAPGFTQITGATSPLAGYHHFFSGGSGVGWANVGTYTTFGDLDGDGLLDMLVGGDHTLIYYFRNVGTTEYAQFVPDWDTNPFSGANSIGFGGGGFDSGVSFSEIIPIFVDLNGDGKLDIVFGAWGNANLNYMENVGTTTAPAFELRTGAGVNPFHGLSLANAAAPSFADLDGDGDLDLIVGGADGAIRYFENTGTASAPVFTARTGVDNPFNGIDYGTYSNATLADFDGDGDYDLVYAHQGVSFGAAYTTLRWFQNSGDATNPVFSELTGANNPLNGMVYFGFSPTAADLDGDGDPDLVTGHSGVPYTTYLRNDGRTGQQIVVNVTPEDDDLGVNPGAGAANYIENAPAGAVAPSLTLSSPDGPLVFATISIASGFAAAEDTLAFTNTDASAFGDVTAVYDAASGVLTLTSAGGATVAQWQNALRAVTYSNNSDAPDTTPRSISFVVNDGLVSSDPAVRQLTVTAVNDAPTVVAPATIALTEDVAEAVTGLVFADVDAGSAAVTVTLTVPSGALSATSGGSVAVASVTDGISLTGSIADINAFVLAGSVLYTPAANHSGTVVLTVLIEDGGATGTGGALSASATVDLEIAPVADAPTIAADATISGFEDQVVDIPLTVTLTDADGSESISKLIISGVPAGWALAGPAGSSASEGPTGTWTILAGTATLSGSIVLQMVPAADANGDVNLQITAYSRESVGGDEAASTPQDLLVSVAPVNDAPTGADNTVAAAFDQAYVFTANDFGFSDPVDGHSLLGVVITTLPIDGALTNDAVPVNELEFISIADIDAGKLQFTPDSGGIGSGYATFTFQVRDDGGTDHGGIDTDPIARTLTIDVMPPNQAPTASIVPPLLQRIGGEILVNTATEGQQYEHQVTALEGGGWVVTWTDTSQSVLDGGVYVEDPFDPFGGGYYEYHTDIKAQVFAADGSKTGSEILVNTVTDYYQSQPQVTALVGGGFAIAWVDFSGLDDTSQSGLKAQVFGADGSPVGAEVLVNTATAGHQQKQQMSALSDGGFVVVWQDHSGGVGGATGDASGSAIKAQLFDAGGAAVGSEILVNTTVTGAQSVPQIATLEGGNGFVVVWWDESSGGPNRDVRAQVFTEQGAKLGGEILVNSPTAGWRSEFQIAALDGGGFAIVWTDGAGSAAEVKLQLFDAAGTPVGSEVHVNTATANAQDVPQIAALDGGGFVVTWNDASAGNGGATGDTSARAVKAQVFDASGAKIGGEILVNTAVEGEQLGARPSALPGGGFVVVWNDFSQGVGGATGDSDSYAVKAQFFDGSGNKVGEEVLVNTVTAGTQGEARVVTLPDGTVAVVWSDGSGLGGDSEPPAIKAQLLSTNGSGGYSAVEQIPLDLKDAGLSVSDVDAGSGIVTVTLKVEHGVLHLEAGTSGVIVVSGNDSGEVVINGTIAQINALLNTDASSVVRYTADMDDPPSSTLLTLEINDNGNTGGGALTDAATATIFITPVNDAPTDVTVVGGVLSVAEFVVGGTTVGTVVGQVEAVDPDHTSGFVYSLLNDAGGRFGIDSVTGIITVVDPYLLDHEQNASHEIIVRVVDPDGLHFDKTLVVNVDNVDPEWVIGDDRPNIFIGGDGNDNLSGRGGDDVLNGRAGNDTIHGDGGDDTIYGGAGDDTIRGGAGADYLRGGSGNDTIHGGNGDDTIYGGARDDIIYGGSGNDIIYGGDGADYIRGGDGDDYIRGGYGDDTIYGGSGHDTIQGGPGDDTIYGGTGDDAIYGGAGDDTIHGDAGHDTIYGDAGNDTIYGGDGNDTIHGGDGDDTIHGDAGDDTIHGGAGDDTIFGGEGDDIIYGGAGNDTISGGDGEDYIRGGSGDDFIRGDAGNDVIYGGAGNDVIHGGAGDDVIYGGEGDDDIRGGDGDDYIRGGSGDDFIRGGGGDDIIHGGAGNDTIHGGSGNDTIYGDAGNDTIHGGAGNDTIWGGDGDDFIDGGAGDDVIYGDAGNDTIHGDRGNDTIYGGDGNDLIYGGDGDDFIYGESGDDFIYGDAGNDTIHGGEGNDTIRGGDGDDFIRGDAGDDLIYGDDGNDTIHGGDGDDTIYGGAGNDTIRGGAGADYIRGGSGNDFIRGDAGDDVIYGSAGDDEIYGGEGNDTIYGGDGADYIRGGAGDDEIYGGAGNDTIHGGAGDDLISGGRGSDILSGGLGADQFVYQSPNEGSDTILDFNRTEGDRFVIHTAAFGGGLAAGGALDASRLVIGSAPVATAAAGTGQFLYDTNTGGLYWDADGAGGQAALHIADLTGVPDLSASDFNLV